MSTWRELLTEHMALYGDTFASIESSTLLDSELDQEFDSGYGSSQGCPFTVWTAKRVYFPAVYDGAEWVESVSRHPDGESTSHIGGQ